MTDLTDPYTRLLWRVARMWQSAANSWDIAKAIGASEPEVMRMLDECRARHILPRHWR